MAGTCERCGGSGWSSRKLITCYGEEERIFCVGCLEGLMKMEQDYIMRIEEEKEKEPEVMYLERPTSIGDIDIWHESPVHCQHCQLPHDRCICAVAHGGWGGRDVNR